MHSLYRRSSLYRSRLLRCLRYGRGHGVHSPFAYRVVCEVVRPRYDYYLPTPEDDRMALWYRLIARLRCDYVTYGSDIEEVAALRGYAALADSRIPSINLDEVGDRHRGLLYTDCAEEAKQFLRTTGRGVLLVDIRRTKAQEAAFAGLVGSLDSGIVIDLFDEALLFSKNNHLYIYRSTL